MHLQEEDQDRDHQEEGDRLSNHVHPEEEDRDHQEDEDRDHQREGDRLITKKKET